MTLYGTLVRQYWFFPILFNGHKLQEISNVCVQFQWFQISSIEVVRSVDIQTFGLFLRHEKLAFDHCKTLEVIIKLTNFIRNVYREYLFENCALSTTQTVISSVLLTHIISKMLWKILRFVAIIIVVSCFLDWKRF